MKFKTCSNCFLSLLVFSLAANVSFPTPSAEAALTDGLIAYYKFDETTGVVIDSAGSHDGTNYGATRGVPGKVGNAFQFNGISDYLDTILPGDIPTVITIGLWVYPTDSSAGAHQIFGSIDTTDGGKDGFVGQYTGDPTIPGNPTNNAYFVYYSSNVFRGDLQGSSNSVQPNTWTHLTFTIDSSNNTGIYVNGLLDATGSLSVSPTSHDRALMFGKGAFSGAGSHYYGGLLDDVRIWNRVLSAQEVVSLVPEPATLAMVGLACLGMAAFRRRKSRQD